MSMTEGSPEARLWAAVVGTFIDDFKEELKNQISLKGIDVTSQRWTNRAMENSFGKILDLIDLDQKRLTSWIETERLKSRKALLLRGESAASSEENLARIARLERRKKYLGIG